MRYLYVQGEPIKLDLSIYGGTGDGAKARPQKVKMSLQFMHFCQTLKARRKTPKIGPVLKFAKCLALL